MWLLRMLSLQWRCLAVHMRSSMLCQMRTIKVSFPTDVTNVWSLTSVGSSHVDLQGILTCKIVPTYFANERPLTCVDSLVNNQIWIKPKGFSTCITFKRQFTRVSIQSQINLSQVGVAHIINVTFNAAMAFIWVCLCILSWSKVSVLTFILILTLSDMSVVT